MARIICAGKTDVGRRRTNNEDALAVAPDLGFLAVADGMGGAASGQVASALFVEKATQVFANPQLSGKTISELVQMSFFLANKTIWDQASHNPEHAGMGCTAELFSFDAQDYVIGHVGDSRTYLLRNSTLRQLTKDHSLVQSQIDEGLLDPHAVRGHVLKNIILRAVGVGGTLSIDLVQGKMRAGDIFLLCSDGLSDMVIEEDILSILCDAVPLEEKVDRLIAAANSAGGRDNVTAVLCEFS